MSASSEATSSREFSMKKFKRQLEDESGLRIAHPQVAALQNRLMAAQSEIAQLQNSPESPEKERLKHQCAVLRDELVVMQDHCRESARQIFLAQTHAFENTAEEYKEVMTDHEFRALAQ